jgi:hypothetical protein
MTATDRGEPANGPDRSRDLHDGALQRLFGAGLALQSTLASITDPGARECVRHCVTVLDEIIDELRSLLHAVPEREAGADRRGRGTADSGPSALFDRDLRAQE